MQSKGVAGRGRAGGTELTGASLERHYGRPHARSAQRPPGFPEGPEGPAWSPRGPAACLPAGSGPGLTSL